MKHVAVIGAGIIGLSTAVEILEQNPTKYQVTVIADKFSPNTTSDVAAGLWTPYLATGDHLDRDREWARETYNFMANAFYSSKAKDMGISQVSGYCLLEEVPKPSDYPFWISLVEGFRVITENEARRFGANFKSGYFYTAYTLNCEVYLPYLLEKFRGLGGASRYERVDNIKSLAKDFDIVVNCTGVESAKFLDDPNTYPIRGQIFKVKAPWIKNFVLTLGKENSAYIIPRETDVVLGGTAQKNNWNLNVAGEDSKEIWKNCLEMMPSLQASSVISERVGLRPGRANDARLDVEILKTSHKDLWVIHNYGHGGSGVTFSKGVATNCARMLSAIPNVSTSHL